MLYNVPSRTGQSLLPETIAKLAETPSIVAVKEASGSLDQATRIRRLTPPEFSIYSGDDSLTLPLLAIGACGVVSVASHLVGESLQEMVQAFEKGNVAAATQIHLKLSHLFDALFMTTNPIPLKAALNLQGWDVGVPRLPLCVLEKEQLSKLKAVLLNLALLPA